jgi:hypothetical protein
MRNEGSGEKVIGYTLQQMLSKERMQISNLHTRFTLERIGQCRTAVRGYHLLECKAENREQGCGHSQVQYHSCGNRHCPNCGGLRGEEWVEARKAELLPGAYYHCVFTLPEALNSLIMGNRRVTYKLLMDASAQTLLILGKDEKWLGGTLGITSILHTWGQTLSFHPHVHCIVSGGGVKPDNSWIKPKRENHKFLIAKGALRKVFKGLMMDGIRKLHKAGKLKTAGIDLEKVLKTIGYQRWNIYAKAPFKDAQGVVDYLGRYTHKIAITRHRVKQITETEIRFAYRDYKDGNKSKEMTLSHGEFTRRFAQHILPKGFVKIRHYGYLKNQNRSQRLAQIREKLHIPQPAPKVKVPSSLRLLEKYGVNISKCPHCEKGKMEIMATLYREPANRGKLSASKGWKDGEMHPPP